MYSCHASYVTSHKPSTIEILDRDLASGMDVVAMIWSTMPTAVADRASSAQLRALVTVRKEGGTTVSELAAALNALPSSATRLCDRLVAAGLIERLPDVTNRRFHTVSLTPAGEDLLRELDQFRTRCVSEILALMPETERDDLVRGLASFARHAQEAPCLVGPAWSEDV